METKMFIFRLEKEKNEMLDKILDSIKNISSDIRKARFYFLAGAYGFYLGKRKALIGVSSDVARAEFLNNPDYKFAKIIVESIYEAEKQNKNIDKNKYRLFEEYANGGVEELYNILKDSDTPEDFIEELEVKINEAIEKNNIFLYKNEEEESNEEI